MSSYALQPCPFCGCTDHLEFEPLDKAVMLDYRPIIHCSLCGVTMDGADVLPTLEPNQATTADFKGRNELLITLWNTRNGRVIAPAKKIPQKIVTLEGK